MSEGVLPWLAGGLRSDSALTVALTLSPVIHSGTQTVGASDWSKRVGVFSLQDVMSGAETLCPVTLERAVKLVLHQVMHMLGLLHCCYFRCLMNGAANEEEADGRPPYLCAMCLRKLNLVTGMDPLQRYLQLAHFWSWAGNDRIALWYETRVRMVRSTFSTSTDAVLPPAPRHQRLHSRIGRRNHKVLGTSQSIMRPSTDGDEDDDISDFGKDDDESEYGVPDAEGAWWRTSSGGKNTMLSTPSPELEQSRPTTASPQQPVQR